MTLSVVIITHNEEANLVRTLKSVGPLVSDGKGEIVVVDSGSIDHTVEIAMSFGAKVFVETWKGYAAQKNSAIEKAEGDYIFSLDADEQVSSELASEIEQTVRRQPAIHKVAQRTESGSLMPLYVNGFWIPRRNHFLGKWIKHGGFWPDPKLRLFRRGKGRFKEASVHETLELEPSEGAGITATPRRLRGALIHHSYPTLAAYIEHMNRYSSLGAEMVVEKANGKVRFSVVNIVARPLLTFIYNYVFRLGFLDGREGLLLHLYHAVYVSWKYAKAWELSRKLPQ